MDIGILIRRSKRTSFIHESVKYRAEFSLREKLRFYVIWARRGRTEITPYIGYQKYVSPKGYDFELFMSQKGIDFDQINVKQTGFHSGLTLSILFARQRLFSR